MLPGFSGRLVTEFFLEEVAGLSGLPGDDERRRRFVEWRRRCLSLGPTSSLRSLLEVGAEPFLGVLGFSFVDAVEQTPATLTATAHAGAGTVALVVTSWAERLDAFWRAGVIEARRRGSRFCLLFSGTHARLLDAARLFERRYAEFDLGVAIDDARGFGALWKLLAAEAITSDRDGTTLDRLIVESDRAAEGVCRSLRDGVLDASTSVLTALLARPTLVEPSAAFEQTLTIVYRLLFLLFAEARGLVPLWHPVYRGSYSVEALREQAERRSPCPGLWDALRAMTRLAHAGCEAGSLRVTAFNGRLFAPSRTPLAERRNLDDNAARTAVLALSMRPAARGGAMERIAYRDLGVEQLGAVYETLLDYEPKISRRPNRRAPPTVFLVPGSGARRATGTFYTPQPLAQYLVRRTLGPLVANARPEQILRLKVLDPAMGSGAFLVAACRFLADAYEAALVACGDCRPGDVDERQRSTIRRAVAERCLYGVDKNPMAVQLARLSVWLATLAPDRPLGFLDHHLLTGDSLLGAWLSSLRRPPGRTRAHDPATLPLFKEDAAARAVELALPVRFKLATGPSDTAAQVHEKERALLDLSRPDAVLSKWKRVADLWCSRWFAHTPPPASAFGALSDAILSGTDEGFPPTFAACLDDAGALAARHAFFHWELEFPEAFFDQDGQRSNNAGFDAVIGNPPWDMLRQQPGAPPRRTGRKTDAGDTLAFAREAGLYRAQSGGHVNRYQLFVERAVALVRHGGRMGLVLPGGAISDHGSAGLRRLLFSECALDAIVGFENRDGVFPIHRGLRFVLLTAAKGGPTRMFGCRLGERDPAVLEEEDADGRWLPLDLSPEIVTRLTGDALAIPDLRAPVDLAVAERAATLFPPLGSKAGWGATFGRELNATDDRPHFTTGGRGLPVVDGKHIEPFRVRLDMCRQRIAPSTAERLLRGRTGRPRLAYRDVASATNRVTLIAAVLPAGCVSTHTLFCLRTPLPMRAHHFLCGCFNSLIVNFLVRMRVTTHVTTAIVEHLPLPLPDLAPAACRDIGACARLLARAWNDDTFVRLNVLVARLYQLSRDELDRVLETFPLIAPAVRAAIRDAFHRASW